MISITPTCFGTGVLHLQEAYESKLSLVSRGVPENEIIVSKYVGVIFFH
jgi:hypothetical protein